MIKSFIINKGKNFLWKSNNFTFVNNNSSKKGLMALEALTGTILSVIALFIIFQVFTSVFLQTPTNLKIAEANAQSIVDFVDFSENKYKELGIIQNCDFMLKLTNIENFQLGSGNKKYFYIIDNKYIYIFDWDYLPDLLSKKNIDLGLSENKINFKDDINLMLDKTSDGEIISFSFEFFNFGGADNNLILSNNGKFILLIPQFKMLGEGFLGDVGEFFNFYHILDSNQNNLMGSTSYNGDMIIKGNSNTFEGLKQAAGNYLTYFPEKNNFFLSNSEVTNALTRNNLCFRYEIQKDTLNERIKKLAENSPEKLDEVNNKIIIECIVDSNSIEGNFKWDNGPICENNLEICKDFNRVGDNKYNLNDIKYVDFLDKLKTNCNLIKDGHSSVFKVTAEIKSLSEIRDDNLDFDKIFIKLDTTKTFNDIKDDKYLISNIKTMSCSNPNLDCEYMYLQGNNVYFFYNYKGLFKVKDYELTHFLYKINVDYLRESIDNGDLKIYFNNKEINLNNAISYNLKQGFWENVKFWKSDDIKIYEGVMQFNGAKTIYLTQKQVDSLYSK